MTTLLFSICFVFPQHYNISKYQQKILCKYEHEIHAAAKKYDIEPELLTAVIYVESSFSPRVVSKANACGLTQVIPKWTGGQETSWKKYTCEQLKNPRRSIWVGAQILSYNIHKYGAGNVEKGLCGYNAGTKCFKKKGFYKRLRYVKKVMEIYNTLIDGDGC